jgi:GTP-binding protein
LIDTAGVRKKGRVFEAVEKFSVVKTLQAIDDAQVVILVMDGAEQITDQDLHLLGYVLEAGRSLVLAVNKWDGLDEYQKTQVKEEIDRRLGFANFARLHFISALHGSGVGNLFDSVHEAFDSASLKVSTSKMTELLEQAQREFQAPTANGRRVKMRYAHLGGHHPFRVVIHGNSLSRLPEHYQRYLINFFRRELKLVGAPIRLEMKEGDNPFEGKGMSNKLYQRRQRLIRHRKG